MHVPNWLLLNSFCLPFFPEVIRILEIVIGNEQSGQLSGYIRVEKVGTGSDWGDLTCNFYELGRDGPGKFKGAQSIKVSTLITSGRINIRRGPRSRISVKVPLREFSHEELSWEIPHNLTVQYRLGEEEVFKDRPFTVSRK